MNMFDILQTEGIIVFGEINENRIRSLKLACIIDTADAICEWSTSTHDHPSISTYIHSASLGLEGTPDECSTINCRLRRINQLAHYAALYSDGVFVHNSFSDYSSICGHPPACDSVEFRRRIADDVCVFLAIRPLIEAGIIKVFTPDILSLHQHLCANCLAEVIFDTDDGHRFLDVFHEILQVYLKQSSVEAFYEYGYYCVSCSGPEMLYEHGGKILSSRSPSILSWTPKIRARIERGETVLLSQNECKKLNIHQHRAAVPVRSVVYQAAVANRLKTSLLMHRELDIDILHAMSNHMSDSSNNAMILEHLQAMVPFAGDVPIAKLLELRQREAEAFTRFQAALGRIIGEIRSERGMLSERIAKELYSNVVRSRVAELNQKVSEAKRDLVYRPLASLAGTAAALSFGFISGLLTTELKVIAGGLGLFKIINDAAANTVKIADVQKSIRNIEMYFLWKVKEAAENNQHTDADR